MQQQVAWADQRMKLQELRFVEFDEQEVGVEDQLCRWRQANEKKKRQLLFALWSPKISKLSRGERFLLLVLQQQPGLLVLPCLLPRADHQRMKLVQEQPQEEQLQYERVKNDE